MRKLTREEMGEVSGGDGVHLGGNMYVSSTNTISGRLGVLGAATLAFNGGYALGSALDSQLGISESLGGWAYERS